MCIRDSYHAEAAEAEVFSSGVQRLLDNVMKSLTSTSLMSFGATLMMGILCLLYTSNTG